MQPASLEGHPLPVPPLPEHATPSPSPLYENIAVRFAFCMDGVHMSKIAYLTPNTVDTRKQHEDVSHLCVPFLASAFSVIVTPISAGVVG